MTENKRFQYLKKHYDIIEDITYVGMVFWFVPFTFAIGMFRNDIVNYICIFMFALHFFSVGVLFDDNRLWRWIK